MLEVMVGDVMVMIEIMIEGEMVSLALGWVWGVDDSGGLVYGSPRKEKRIWSWRGERRFWAGR